MREGLLIAYVVAVQVAAAVLVAMVPGSGLGERPGTAILLIGMAGLAGARPVRLPSLRVNLTASHPFVLTALVAVGPLAAIIADLVGVLGAALGRKQRPLPTHFLFNVGASVLATGSAWGVFAALGGRPDLALNAVIGPMAAAAGVYFVVNSALLVVAIALEKNRKLLHTWRASCLWTLVPFLAGVTLAATMLALIDILIPWGLLLAVAPCWVLLTVYRGHPSALDGRSENTEPSSRSGPSRRD